MALKQGYATAWSRKGAILFTANSLVPQSSGFDEEGFKRGPTVTDLEAYHALLISPCSKSDLGRHLKAALVASRIDRPIGWYDPGAKEGTSRIAGAFGLKSVSSLYRDLRLVSVSWTADAMRLMPTSRQYGGWFKPLHRRERHRRFDSPDDVIGKAVQDAISASD